MKKANSVKTENISDKNWGEDQLQYCSILKKPTDINSGKVKFLPLGRWRGTLQPDDLPVNYIKISEHLDMLGVKIKATYAQTKRINCDEMYDKLSNLTRVWKSGRYMPLSMRSWSLNSFALPLLWYKAHCIDMREGDYSRLTSCVKSWLYADMLEKPEELLMVRDRREGGLGVHHVKSKVTAILIKSF